MASGLNGHSDIEDFFYADLLREEICYLKAMGTYENLALTDLSTICWSQCFRAPFQLSSTLYPHPNDSQALQ